MGFVTPFDRHNVGWKTFPSLEVLGQTPNVLLARALIAAGCANGMVPIKKLEKAILSCQRTAACNLSRRPNDELALKVGLTIRVMMQKWRWLKDEPADLATCLSRVGRALGENTRLVGLR